MRAALALLLALAAGLAAADGDAERGRYVAILGDCAGCHGADLAGGRALDSPLGRIYASNITPDRDSGIGAYAEADFLRLMRQGVAPDGTWIYPAMPFTSYGRMTDQDLRDLFAYLQGAVAPVRKANRPTAIPWPLSWRAPLALWTRAFSRATPFLPDPSRDEAWNRGAYLVQGPGHCGACHTPRNPLLAEPDVDGHSPIFLSGAVFAGGAPINLRGNDGDGLGRWNEEDIVQLLKSGRNRHSAVSGAMTEVVGASTQFFTDADLAAIAHYLKSLAPADPRDRARFTPSGDSLQRIMAGRETSPGGRIFMDSCAACHRLAGDGAERVFPGLAGNPMVLSRDPSSLIAVILDGTRLPSTAAAPSPLAMPGFAWRYDDAELAALASFVRSAWGNQATAVTAGQVARLRHR